MPFKKKYIKGTAEEMMVEDGVTFDGPDILGHIFDTVFCLQKDASGRNIATLHEGKDRTNKFRDRVPFEYNYQNVVAAFGNRADLEREPVQFNTELALGERTGRKFLVTVNGKPQRTAGVTGDTLEKILNQIASIVSANIAAQEGIMADLREKYQIQTLADLREDEGKFVLNDLQNILYMGHS